MDRETAKTILRNRDHKKTNFDEQGTAEQVNLFQGNKGTGTFLGWPHFAHAHVYNLSYTLYLIETPFNTFGNRVDPGQQLL